MRARHRHFQFKHAGAVLSLDARFVHGVSDAANLETWSDRSGNANNATRTVSDIPTYRAAEINGLPAIRFDGKYYDFAGVTIPLSSTTVAALRRTTAGTRSTPLGTSGAQGRYSFLWFSDNNIYSRHNIANGLTNATGQTQTGNFVWGGVWDVRSSTARRNGAVVGSTQTSTADADGAFNTLGRWNNANASCSWGAYHFLDQAAPAPLRKRLEHHVAYSFKISCN